MSGPLKSGKEAYLRAEGRVYLVEILGVAKDSIWISFPDTTPPAPGVGVELDLDEEDGVRRYHARVGASGAHATGLMLERTETARVLKHRRNFRVPVNTSIWVSGLAGGEKAKGRLGDLSADGARIVSEHALDVGDSVTLQIRLEGQPVTEFPARVVYANPSEKPGEYPVYGVKFAELATEARTRLTIYLAEEIGRVHAREVYDMYPRGGKKKKTPG